jgi:hypothetical protein
LSALAHAFSKARNKLALLEKIDGTGLNWQANSDGQAYADLAKLDNVSMLCPITPDDLLVYDPVLNWICCAGVGGNLTVLAADDTVAKLLLIYAGEKIARVDLKKVMSTGTTATTLIGGRNNLLAGWAPGAPAAGVLTLPSWMSYSCATANRRTQTGPATRVDGIAANLAPWRSVDGVAGGLSVESTRTNLIKNNLGWDSATTGWNAGDASRTAGETDPAGGASAIKWAGTVGKYSAYTSTYTPGNPWAISLWTKQSAGVDLVSLTSDQAGAIINPLSAAAAWAFQSAKGTFANAMNAYLLWAGTRTLIVDGLQLEAGSYPTSCIVNGDAPAARAIARLSVPAVQSFCLNGYFDVSFLVRPHYASTETAADHDILYVNSNNRLFFEQSSRKMTFKCNGNSLASSALTFSREQALRVRAWNRPNGKGLRVSGATAGDGLASGVAEPAAPTVFTGAAYLLGNSSGAQESATLSEIIWLRPY